jgi:tetrahydromethanopterin S-methyltransferase subunit G
MNSKYAPIIGLIMTVVTLLSSGIAFGLKYENRISTLEEAVKDQSRDLKYIKERLDDLNDKIDMKIR